MTTSLSSAHARRALGDATDPLVVAPPPALVRAIVDSLRGRREASTEAPEHVRLLCTRADADAAFADFLTAADATNAVDAGQLAVRTVTDLDASLTVADGTVRALLRVGDDESSEPPGLDTVVDEDEALYDVVSAAYDARWADADDYDFGVPGRTTLLESFRDRWPDAGDTLADLFDAVESFDGTDPLDPVTACTLVAAHHRVLAMRLGEWAEEVGFSSRTEIARAKTRLVESGIIDTEREPAGVGRPRHRLIPADESLADATAADLLSRGRNALDA